MQQGTAHTQVFVDDSGRRRRWTRLAGSGVTAACALYIAITVVGLAQTTVGPLIAVPTSGNGQVAGFPDIDGTVPGLLATGGVAPAAPKAGSSRTSSTTKPATAEKAGKTATTEKTANPASTSATARTAPTSTTKPSAGSGRAATTSRVRSAAA